MGRYQDFVEGADHVGYEDDDGVVVVCAGSRRALSDAAFAPGSDEAWDATGVLSASFLERLRRSIRKSPDR